MAWIYADRVLDTSVTAGTGALTLSGTSPLGWRTFSTACAVADTFYYTVHDPITGAWETGEGTYSALNTVSRTTVRQSSNANALVSFAANPKNVFIDVIGYYFANVSVVGGPYLPLAGGTLTGPLTGTTATFGSNLYVGTSPSEGFVRLNEGGPVNAGYIGFYKADTTRLGYIGFDNANMAYTCEVGSHAFAGPVTLAGALTGTTATFSGTVSAPGAQIQMVSTQTGAVATGTTLIPVDDTIPQITEGNEYMTLAITPKSATSKLIIEVQFVGGSSAVNNLIVALFQDAIANALAASQAAVTAAGVNTVSLRHVMTSGTTSATTFRVRAGGTTAATTTFNGSGGARFLGGAYASSIVIREVV